MATQTAQSMISEVSICNQALGYVGQNPISSLDDPHPSAEWCKNNYDFLRDAVLEAAVWNFAKGRDISTSGDKDDWNNWYKHRIPEEWLAVYRVFEDSEGKIVAKWEREGEWILSDCETVYLWGIKRIIDTSKFSNLFVQALCGRMAAEMAIPFTENRQLQADLWQLYEMKLRDAVSGDGIQGRNEIISPAKEKPGKLVSRRRI